MPEIDSRFSKLPTFLAERARSVRIPNGAEGIPALIAHPNWSTQAPMMLWMHGRTAFKELDPGRYLRWLRAGIGFIAIDLPGHGERFDAELQSHAKTLFMLDRARPEVDLVVDHLRQDAELATVFDLNRMSIGGMSAGGMVTLNRLCSPHPFVCAAVESTAGSFDDMPEYTARYDQELIDRINPSNAIDQWKPIPLLALHSEIDRVVPLAAITSFLDDLRQHYREELADPESITLKTWPMTGAPDEHAGFGRVANDAKNAQRDFLIAHLRPEQP